MHRLPTLGAKVVRMTQEGAWHDGVDKLRQAVAALYRQQGTVRTLSIVKKPEPLVDMYTSSSGSALCLKWYTVAP